MSATTTPTTPTTSTTGWYIRATRQSGKPELILTLDPTSACAESARIQTCHVRWHQRTRPVPITGSGEHVTLPLPEPLHDLSRFVSSGDMNITAFMTFLHQHRLSPSVHMYTSESQLSPPQLVSDSSMSDTDTVPTPPTEVVCRLRLDQPMTSTALADYIRQWTQSPIHGTGTRGRGRGRGRGRSMFSGRGRPPRGVKSPFSPRSSNPSHSSSSDEDPVVEPDAIKSANVDVPLTVSDPDKSASAPDTIAAATESPVVPTVETPMSDATPDDGQPPLPKRPRLFDLPLADEAPVPIQRYIEHKEYKHQIWVEQRRARALVDLDLKKDLERKKIEYKEKLRLEQEAKAEARRQEKADKRAKLIAEKKRIQHERMLQKREADAAAKKAAESVLIPGPDATGTTPVAPPGDTVCAALTEAGAKPKRVRRPPAAPGSEPVAPKRKRVRDKPKATASPDPTATSTPAPPLLPGTSAPGIASFGDYVAGQPRVMDGGFVPSVYPIAAAPPVVVVVPAVVAPPAAVAVGLSELDSSSAGSGAGRMLAEPRDTAVLVPGLSGDQLSLF